MSYRVLIPTAGTGSRLGGLTKYINKSLVSIAGRPTISHIIERFPRDVEFVIALGHKGELVREFLTLAYPDRKFHFATVHPFEGPGSGLGLSVMACREFLQQPFIFISCDTLVKGTIPSPDRTWLGFAETASLEGYRTLEIDNGKVKSVCEKGVGRAGTHKAYIGLAGISDFQTFWKAMEQGGTTAITTGEAHGVRALLDGDVAAVEFDWYDTGNPQALEHTRNVFREPGAPNILEKANEAIWFVEDRVVKFSDDRKFIANRYARARLIADYVPEIIGCAENMYCYRRAKGKILSEAVSVPLFKRLLDHSQTFWERRTLNGADEQKFVTSCMRFYRDKTFERVVQFYRTFDRTDDTETINEIAMPHLDKMLHDLDWDWLARGLPGRFHGDFHFENILYDKAADRFTFLDWRQDFGGSLEIGDIYYDLAKLLHGLIVCHELIAADEFDVSWETGAITCDFRRKQILVECEHFFYEWLSGNGYDVRKVKILTALIYLNIAALHHYPYCLMLFALGKSMLRREMLGASISAS